MKKGFFMATLSATFIATNAFSQEATAPSTRVAKWRNDAKGALVLYYDDGTDSAIQFAVPTLNKYKVNGTFYLCAGWFEKSPKKLDAWMNAAKLPSIHVANHTWSHSGAANIEIAETEIQKDNDVLRARLGIPQNALMSYCRPGGTKWETTREEEKIILDKFSLIARPHEFGGIAGPKNDIKTAQDAISKLNQAESSGNLTYIMFHGVGGDWFNFPAADHEVFIRECAIRQAQNRVWIPATITAQKYEAARNGASLSNHKSGETLSVDLTVSTNPAIYDEPLTLVTQVPSDWLSATILQGNRLSKTPVHNGQITYDVEPASGTITISKDGIME